jgi:competence ComEA-like helix-hairpin-helix protein
VKLIRKNPILLFPLIILAIAILFSACQAIGQRANTLPQDPLIQTYFNHNQKAHYTDPYRQIKREGDNLEKIIIDTINSAQVSVDLAVQELRLPLVAQALVKKQKTGVKVRVILENLYNQSITNTLTEKEKKNKRSQSRQADYIAFVDLNNDGRLSEEEMNQRDAITILNNARTPVIDDTEDGSRGTGLMHHKFMVIDEKTVLVTSANFTLSDQHGDYTRSETRGNANNLLVIQSSELAQYFTAEFNLMWGDGVGGKKDSLFGTNKPFREARTFAIGKTQVSVKFSPDNNKIIWFDTSNGLIAQTLSQSQKNVSLALFVWSEQPLADLLENQQKKGVTIKALIDPEFAFRPYSEGLDLLGVEVTQECRAEANNNPWSVPLKTVGIPNLTKGDKLHHKMGIVDQNLVITGSHNWSDAANRLNDETLLVLNNPVINAHYQREFEQLYQNANLGVPEFVQKAIAQEKQKCAVKSTQPVPVPSPVSSQISSQTTSPNQLINLNTATKEELDSLPGVGPKLSDRILQARQEKPFTSLEDLKRVSGIGESKLQKLAGKVTW